MGMLVLYWKIGRFVTVYFPVFKLLAVTMLDGWELQFMWQRKFQRTTQNSNNQKQFLVSRIGELDKAVSELEG